MKPLRKYAKKFAPLYWVVGLIRYLDFKSQLFLANRRYSRGDLENSLPPPSLRFRVHRALDAESYVATGRAVSKDICNALASVSFDGDGAEILDFACGPGRVVKFVADAYPRARISGTDIDDEAIEWASNHLGDRGDFRVNGYLPPTSYSDGSFDLVYCISLFTHLNEEMQFSWLTEMARLLKPHGLLLATTHGKMAQNSCTEEEVKLLERRGVLFRTDRVGKFKLDGLPDFYQTTFHTKSYILANWTRDFEILDYLEGGLQRHQDIVLLRRRDEPANGANIP